MTIEQLPSLARGRPPSPEASYDSIVIAGDKDRTAADLATLG